MLVLDRAINEWISIEPAGIKVTFLGFSREGEARIGIAAPQEQDIIRGELAAKWVRREPVSTRRGRDAAEQR